MATTANPSGPHVIRMKSSAFEVVGLPDISPVFKVRAEAEKWMRNQLARLPESRRPRERTCLCCGRPFESEGPHNRMCNPCRGRAEVFASVGSLARPSGPGRLSTATRKFAK